MSSSQATTRVARVRAVLWAWPLFALPLTAEANEGLPAPDLALEVDTSSTIAPLEALLDTDFVRSASLRTQSRYEAPVSITVITHEQIIDSGALDLAEVLRRVVGVQVSATTANGYAAGLRGSNSPLSYRVAVYLDGRNLADIAFGYIKWNTIPLNPEEIERIEIIRGPGATLYGANALSGVINIVSRKPIDHAGLDASAAGTLSVLPDSPDRVQGRDSREGGGQGYVAHSWVNRANTLGLRASFGYAREREWIEDPALPEHGDFDYHARITFDARPSPTLSLFAAIDHAAGESLVITGGGATTLRLFTADQTLQLTLEDRAFLDLPLGLTAKTSLRRSHNSTPTLDYYQYEGTGTLQLDHSSLEERNQLTLLAEFRILRVEDFYVSQPSSSYFGVALQDELKLLEDRSLILSVGVRLDAVRTANEGSEPIQYRNVNPRGAIVYRPAERQAIRASVATAYRTPSVFQNFVDIVVPGGPGTPDVAVLVGNVRLEPETILTGELGYVGTWLDILDLEAVLFAQRSRRVIENSPEYRLPYEWINGPAVHQLGAELAAAYQATTFLELAARYTLTRSFDAETGDRKRLFPDHLIGFNAAAELGTRTRVTAELDVISPFEERSLELSSDNGALQLRDLRSPTQYLLSARAAHRIFSGSGEIFVSARNIVGFFRPSSLAQQFPNVAAHPIGGTLIVGLRVFEL